MAVGFTAAGPGATGATTGTSPLTWNHTCAAGDTHLLVGVTLDGNPDTSRALSATYNSQPMTPLGSAVHTNNSSAGFLQVFYLASPPTGSAYQVAVSETGGTFAGINGGSLSFSGSGALSAPQTAYGNSGTASLSFTPTTTGNVVAAFVGAGSTVTQSGSFTQRYNTTGGSGAAGAGFCAAATLASTGSAVTPSWTLTADYWAVIAVEVQTGGTSFTAHPDAAEGNGAAYDAAAAAGTTTSALYAGSASGISGSWADTGNATGSGQGTYATWTDSAAGSSAALELATFNAQSAVPAGSTVISAACTVRHGETPASAVASVTAQAYSGTTPVGSPQPLTPGDAVHDDTVTFTGLAYADLADLRVRVTVTRD